MGGSPKPSVRQQAGRRRNIAVACENCRARKVRCDGCRPVCRACVRRNYTCEYTVSLAPWDRSRQKYVEELERKLQAWEVNSEPSHHGGASVPPSESLVEADDPTHPSSQTTAARQPVLEHDWQGNASLDAPAADGPSPLSGSVHVGQSSTGVFLRHLHQSVVPSTAQTSQSPRTFTLDDLGTHTPLLEATGSHYNLPPRETADELLAIYWRIHHPVYPAISHVRFNQQLEALYAGTAPPNERRMTCCIANLVFALAERSMPRAASMTTDQGSSRYHHDYFEMAKHLLHFDMFGNFSFPMLQALVLSAQFLQSTEKPRQCWAIVGFAISAARSMGLHLADAVKNLQPESERRLAISVWNCLVTIDRTLSMTLGRSPTVSLAVARASTAANDAFPPTFFSHSCRLFDILHDILISLYSEGPEVAPATDIIGHSSRLEKDLDRWVRELPDDDDSSTIAHSRFLRQRYLQVRIILMRPGLVNLLRASSPGPGGGGWDLERATAWYCANQSVDAAAEMAELAAAQTGPDVCQLTVTPWWYQLQYCYNAGVTLLAARVSDKLTEGGGMQRIDEGIANCARAIEACSRVSPTASRCLTMFLAAAARLGRDPPLGNEDGARLAPEGMGAMEGDLAFPWGESWTPFGLDDGSFPMMEQNGVWEDLFSFI